MCLGKLATLVRDQKETVFVKPMLVQGFLEDGVDAIPEYDLQELQGSVKGLGKLRVEGVKFERTRSVPLRPSDIAGETFERKGCFKVVSHDSNNPLAFR